MEEYVGALASDTEGATNIKPKNLTNPWRNGTFSWTWTPAVAGLNNTITYHRIQRNIYRRATSTWDGWVQVKQVGAVTGTQTTTITLDNLNDLDCVRLRIVVVQGDGDNVVTYEMGTWSGISGTYPYQTQNAIPPAPTFVTESPLEISGSTATITLSAKDTSTSYYTTSNGKGKLTFALGKAYPLTTSAVTGTYTSTLSCNFNVYSTIQNFIGTTVTFIAGVNDGFSDSTNSSKTYRIGKNLEAASLTGSGSLLATGTANYKLVTSPAKIDNNSIAATTNYTLQASYSSSSGFKDIKTDMPTTSSGFTITSSKTITDVLGAPSKNTTKVYFRVKVTLSGYTTVYSNVINTTFSWDSINLDNAAINNRDGRTGDALNLYRYISGTPPTTVGPCAYSYVIFTLPKSANVYYTLTSGSTTISTSKNVNSAKFSITSMAEGLYNITVDAYQTMSGGTSVLLQSRTFQSAYYKILKAEDFTYQLTLNDANFLSNDSANNQITFDINLNTSDHPYRLNDVTLKLVGSTLDYIYAKSSLNIYIKENSNNNEIISSKTIPCIIKLNNSNNGFKPSSGYFINSVSVNGNSEAQAGTDCPVNVSNFTLTASINVAERFTAQSGGSTNLDDYTYIENNTAKVLSKTVSNINTICHPDVSLFAISLGGV